MVLFRREGEQREQLLRQAELDAERAKDDISNNEKDIKIREKYKEALLTEGPVVQRRIQKEFGSTHEDAPLPMDFTVLDFEIKFFKERVTAGQLALLEALKHQRHVGANGNDREIEKLERILREKRMALAERKSALLQDASVTFYGYGTGETKGNIDKAEKLGSKIREINNVLEM